MSKSPHRAVSISSAVALALLACGSGSSGGMAAAVDAGVDDASLDATALDTGSVVTGPAGPWLWMPVADSHCRDGSGTGFAYTINPGATQLMIFLEGGGVCFNSVTCDSNASKFGQTELATFTSSETSHGVFSRFDPKNPVKDWNMVYIPYCTGDLHGGANPGGTPPGQAPQQFVGYGNVAADLIALKPLFPGTTRVLLTGVSAGGMGTVINYDQVATAFGAVPVTLVNDSGPTFASPYLATCMQSQLSELWGFDKTVLAACGADCVGDGGTAAVGAFAINTMRHLAKKYPNRVFGLMDSTDDSDITKLYGFGASNCTGYVPLDQPQFTAGLLDVRAQLAFDKNFGTFYFAGTDHTTLVYFFETHAAVGDGGAAVAASDWFSQMVAGTVSNVGP